MTDKVEQCFAYVRRMWNDNYSDPLTTRASTGPQLWNVAASVGYKTSSDAVAKSIACYTDSSGVGHAAWVIKNNGDGTMDISESNWAGTGPTNRTVPIGDRYGSILLGFVYP